jgi:hypothetical protein
VANGSRNLVEVGGLGAFEPRVGAGAALIPSPTAGLWGETSLRFEGREGQWAPEENEI